MNKSGVNHKGFCPKNLDKKAKADSGLGGNGRQPSMPVSKKVDPMHRKPKNRGTVKGNNPGRY